MVSLNATKFVVDRRCVSADIMGLVCHVILLDHEIKV